MIRRHELTNFTHTAQLALACDAVVTVDTSVAHLCGALGVPTVTMLCDARLDADAWLRLYWGVGVDRTLWYGSMRWCGRQATARGARWSGAPRTSWPPATCRPGWAPSRFSGADYLVAVNVPV